MNGRLGAGVVLAVMLAAGCAGGQAGQAEEPAAACQPEEQVPIQGGEHLIGDREPPVPYDSTPPTSGWHASGAVEVRVFGPDEPLSEPRQVSVLERGGVVVTYHDLPDEQRSRLAEHVRARHDGGVALTPYAKLDPGQVAFAAWGVVQRCDKVDLPALDAFVARHIDQPSDDAPH